MSKHSFRVELEPGDDYYRIDHNYGHPLISLLDTEAAENVPLAAYTYMIHPDHIDIQFHSILTRPVTVIVIGTEREAVSTYRTSHGRELTAPELRVGVQLEGVTPEKLGAMVRDYNHMALDLKTAIELIRQYQSHLNRLMGPDPSAVEANKLMRKYNVPLADLRQLPFRIYVDGVDITEHPDSIPGNVVEVDELESGDEEIIDAVEVGELEQGTE